MRTRDQIEHDLTVVFQQIRKNEYDFEDYVTAEELFDLIREIAHPEAEE